MFSSVLLPTCVAFILATSAGVVGTPTGVIFADRVLLNGAVAETLTRLIVPGYRERIIRHEAGHFLVAYLLGCPVQGCLLDPFVVSQSALSVINDVVGSAWVEVEFVGGLTRR